MFAGEGSRVAEKHVDHERINLDKERSCKGVMGERGFSVAWPKLWDFMPLDMRIEENTDELKTKLKTCLFQEIENPNSNFQ